VKLLFERRADTDICITTKAGQTLLFADSSRGAILKL
jgi:hypothetical protein